MLTRIASRLRDPQALRLAAGGLAVVLVAVLVGLRADTSVSSVGSPSATAGASPSNAIAWTPEPGATSAPWARLVLGPDRPLAALTATRVLGSRVATSTSFTLRALGDVGAADLAARIDVEPPATLSVSPGPDTGVVTLRPTKALREGTRYLFKLNAPDGSLAGTWTFKTDAPLHVVGRLPDDRTTDVPRNTGIEVTFDQDSPVGFERHFSISPAVAGRFERHDRTWVFVPDKPLAGRTIYTVKISHGVGISDSDRVLETDVSWQFETAAAEGTPPVTVRFGRPIVESRPGESPTLVIWTSMPDDSSPPTEWPFELYRLPTLDAAAAAVSRLLSQPSWASESANARVDATGLVRVATGKAAVDKSGNGNEWGAVTYLRLPVRPVAGWYLVVIPNGTSPTQAVLQVTDLGAFVQTTDTRMVAWVNDLDSLAPIEGARVAIANGAAIGATDARGLMVATTPTSLIDYWTNEGWYWETSPNLLTVTAPDGRRLLAPVGMDSGSGYVNEPQAASSARRPEGRWWLLLSTDRSQYRTTDTIHAWGLVRARSDLRVPAGLELRLTSGAQSADAPIARVPVSASARGVFSADVPVEDLPRGSYDLALYMGSERLASTWIEITVIRKPAYRIDLSTAHRVYIEGEDVKISGAAVFYDGTQAPGLGMQVSLDERSAEVTANAEGQFAATLPARTRDDFHEGWRWAWIGAHPTDPEEGEISADTEVFVFPSAVWLDGSVARAGSKLTIQGTLSKLDRAAVEKQLVGGSWDLDPAGAAVAGASVRVTVIHLVPVRTQVGTAYDFITKRLEPIYEYTNRETVVASKTLTTSSLGRVSMTARLPAARDDYRVELQATDSAKRPIRLALWDFGGRAETQPWSYPYLVTQNTQCGRGASVTAGLGETAELTVHEGDGSVSKPGQFLFLVGERGLDAAVLQSSSTYSRTFRASDLPSFGVRAVRLTATGYQVLNPVRVVVDRADKTLDVRLTSDRARYRPGDTIKLTVTTTGPDGRPIAADVVVRAVDEKLYQIGGAFDVDVVDSLLVNQPDGFLESYTSHPLPQPTIEPGCGGGGGGREDFRDSPTFQHVTTGPDGRATIAFTAPDDLTSWHVTATAISGALDAGSGNMLVPVGLPFFADALLAPEYLAGEQPVLVVRAYGTSLHAGDPVRFTVRSPDLGLAPVTVAGKAFTGTSIELPALPLGAHRVTIEATASGGKLSDALARTIRVIPSRLTRLENAQQVVAGTTHPGGGSGLTSYLITDAGRGSLIPILDELVSASGVRFDQAAAADVARQVLVDEFGVSTAELPASTFDLARYEREGIALLPYASPDLELTALAAVAIPDARADRDVRGALRTWLGDASATRERRIIALAGLAATGDDVLEDLMKVDRTGLTVPEQLWLAIGLLAAGDETGARGIERAVLTASGQQLGPWVRLVAPSAEETLRASGLMLVLAGGLGDPLAVGLQRYLADQPSTERVFPLETVAYVRGALDRLPRSDARFAWAVAGKRHEVALEPGRAFALTLTAAQRATFAVERLEGDIVVNASWLGEAAASDLPATEGISIVRQVSPPTDAPRDRTVVVTIGVTIHGPVGTYEVIDLLPSGLAPIVTSAAWPEDTNVASSAVRPWLVDGQRVGWTVDTTLRNSWTLRYSARVVTPGTYIWEPAVVQSMVATVLGGHTPPTTFRIK